MGLNPGRSLSTKILLLAALNLFVLAALAVGVVGTRLPRSFEALLLQLGGDRAVVAARQLALEIEGTDIGQFDGVLARYSSTYGVAFVLCRNDGTRVAGAVVELPGEVTARLRAGPPRGPLFPAGPDSRRPPPTGPPDEFVPGGIAEPGSGPDQAPGSGRPPLSQAFLVRASTSPRYWLGVRIPIRSRSVAGTIPGTLLMASSSFWGNPFLFQPGPWLAVGGLGLLLSILCWMPFLRRLTRTIRKMEAATAQIAEGRFDAVVPRGRRDELGRLGTSIAQMAVRLDATAIGQKRFLGDTAHELRSPLGRMRVALEVIETRKHGDPSGYLQDLKDDVDAMTRLTDQLLQFARVEVGSRQASLEPTRLLPAVEQAIRMEARDGTDIRVSVPPGLMVLALPDALQRAIANLIRNAVRYAGSEGPISITADAAAGRVTVVIADCGPGVPADQLERLFVPFYRPDPSRARASGGVGLGLAIVRSAIQACDGTVSCRNRQPSGFEVWLSLAAAPGQMR